MGCLSFYRDGMRECGRGWVKTLVYGRRGVLRVLLLECEWVSARWLIGSSGAFFFPCMVSATVLLGAGVTAQYALVLARGLPQDLSGGYRVVFL